VYSISSVTSGLPISVHSAPWAENTLGRGPKNARKNTLNECHNFNRPSQW